MAIQVGNTGEKAIAAIAVTVIATISALAAPTINGIAVRYVVDGLQSSAGLAIEDGEVLGPIQNASITFVVFINNSIILARITYDVADAVHSAIGCLACHLCASITIQIVDHELRVMLPIADVFTKIDAPQMRAIEIVGIKDRRAGDASM